MPQTGYWPQWYSTSATTTNSNYYIPQTTVTSPNIIWQNWITTSNSTTVTGYQTYANEVWGQWNSTGQQVAVSYQPLPAEEIRELDRRSREATEQRRLARTRARMLLDSFLDPEQKTELEHHGRFHVTGSRGRRYCIRAEGQSGNVDLLKPDGSLQARLCAHPAGYLPEGDAWLMQMIEIRHDEDHFLQTANIHRGELPALV